MRKVLPKLFFEQNTLVVAEKLLGKFLVRAIGKKEIAFMIMETEAYDGPYDKASHAHRGKTPRNEIMFGTAGYWYVYLVYGIHNMLNVVTGKAGYPAAVLIRGVDDIHGPGKVTRRLSVTRGLTTKKIGKESGLWIEDRGVVIPKKDIQKTPRIGVSYAGPLWAGKKYRFVLLRM